MDTAMRSPEKRRIVPKLSWFIRSRPGAKRAGTAPRSALREYGTAQRSRAVCEVLLLDFQRAQDTHIEVRHPRFIVGAPELAVLQPKVGAPRNQRRQVVIVVCRARSAAEQHDRMIQNAAAA